MEKELQDKKDIEILTEFNYRLFGFILAGIVCNILFKNYNDPYFFGFVLSGVVLHGFYLRINEVINRIGIEMSDRYTRYGWYGLLF